MFTCSTFQIFHLPRFYMSKSSRLYFFSTKAERKPQPPRSTSQIFHLPRWFGFAAAEGGSFLVGIGVVGGLGGMDFQWSEWKPFLTRCVVVLLSTSLRAESSSFAILVFSGGEALFWLILSSPFLTEKVFWFLQQQRKDMTIFTNLRHVSGDRVFFTSS